MGGLGEWELALQTFGVGTLDGSGDKKFLNYTDPLGYKRITILFEQAEGNPLVGYFWTADCSGLAHTIVIDPTKVKKEVAVKNANRRNDGLTRAFIRFK